MPQPQILVINVDGLGTFEFARRNMALQFKIEAEYSRLVEGQEHPTPYLAGLADAVSNLKVRANKAPDGWNIDEMDPLDPDSYMKIMRVWGALSEKEESFRPKRNPAGAAAGQGTAGKPGVVVPAPVQPAGDGSAVP